MWAKPSPCESEYVLTLNYRRQWPPRLSRLVSNIDELELISRWLKEKSRHNLRSSFPRRGRKTKTGSSDLQIIENL